MTFENANVRGGDGTGGGPLQGVRIVDLTTMGMGPYATQILADLGADVIKVEAPDGDAVRRVGPMRHPGMGAGFLTLNRNKRSVVLDLKQPDGLAAFRELLKDADALVYNVRPAAMARLGLDHDSVAAINPRLVYCGLYGFRQDGPYGEKPAYDDMIQGLSALPSLFAQAGDGSPRYVPMALADQAVGLVGVYALMGALLARERTGRGQAVDVPMFESMAQFVMTLHTGGATFDPPMGATGFQRHLAPERRPFATADGFICMLLYTDLQWARFFELIGQPQLRDDPRFRGVTERGRHVGPLYAMIAETFAARPTAEWMTLLAAADIPAMPLHTLDSLLADPHLAEIGFFEWVEHPTEGRIRTMDVPTRWSDTPPQVRRQAPALGQHSVEVLREAGLSQDRIERLLAAGVTRQDGA
ncbi:MAG TPA: CoA transferase [Albitalea sp.]|jgi:crotonobetainyl-CoA:carnitine CoA-transferase CaiB-like acyl-CoA transferase|nr:CoA transferase [Albitalea sp.]